MFPVKPPAPVRQLTTGRLLAAAVATIVLLVARVLLGRPLLRPAAAPANWLGETPDAEVRRRLGACEANLANVWEVLNARDSADR